MQLKVIGTGLGRTGTKSLHSALNMVGLGPCHHMMEVFPRPESVPLWVAAAEGKPDWDAIFAEFQSAVDYPAAAHWRAITAYYPNAKVIHTVRDPDKWFDSTQATIFAPDGMVARITANPGDPMSAFFNSVIAPFHDHIHDRAFMTNYFRRHTEEVKATIAPERLLIYEAGQGWAPLCAFLGVPVPDTPYPSENTTAEFQTRVSAAVAAAGKPS
jgi:Sulfotransferase domain